MGPTERITPADRDRFEAMQSLGCLIANVYFGKPGTPGQVHHLLEGGRRLGHQSTIYLHPWYHQGQPPVVRRAGGFRQLTVHEATDTYGPSLAHDKRAFEHRFGTEAELLEMQDELIAALRKLEAGVA